MPATSRSGSRRPGDSPRPPRAGSPRAPWRWSTASTCPQKAPLPCPTLVLSRRPWATWTSATSRPCYSRMSTRTSERTSTRFRCWRSRLMPSELLMPPWKSQTTLRVLPRPPSSISSLEWRSSSDLKFRSWRCVGVCAGVRISVRRRVRTRISCLRRLAWRLTSTVRPAWSLAWWLWGAWWSCRASGPTCTSTATVVRSSSGCPIVAVT
mmetsp:Transcript_55346/g.147668  ORF Transcript_55346/g.147668 Transcript_55346/m.147668 type:complete len:209 (+) Transcript_55346:136-762(+)